MLCVRSLDEFCFGVRCLELTLDFECVCCTWSLKGGGEVLGFRIGFVILITGVCVDFLRNARLNFPGCSNGGHSP